MAEEEQLLCSQVEFSGANASLVSSLCPRKRPRHVKTASCPTSNNGLVTIGISGTDSEASLSRPAGTAIIRRHSTHVGGHEEKVAPSLNDPNNYPTNADGINRCPPLKISSSGIQCLQQRALPGERAFVPCENRTLEESQSNPCVKAHHVTKSKISLPDDFDVPSPPTTSSDDEGDRSGSYGLSFPKTQGQPPLMETWDPPIVSQDSEFYSLSRDAEASEMNLNHVENQGASPVENALEGRGKRYYTKAFDYVLTEVLSRYRHILQGSDISTANMLQKNVSDNAYALFVRTYRRKQPQWYRVSALERSYSAELDVQSAVKELREIGLVTPSILTNEGDRDSLVGLARELLPSLDLSEVKETCASLVNGKSLKRLPRNMLLPALKRVLSNFCDEDNNSRKLKQTTLSGMTPRECLAKNILKRAGRSISIPANILKSLRRIHFLFFLEDGHDSPNALLADAGKMKFPDYKCEQTQSVFSSANAFEDYETALSFEEALNSALEDKDFAMAAHLGSIAEAEVRDFVGDDESGYAGGQNTKLGLTSLDTRWQMLGSRRSDRRKVADRKEIERKLLHPFFRRFTAQWVFARTCWHSVAALERLGEYDNAVNRLQLLLSTELVPRRRGKCLNRLTINLSTHLKQLESALVIITSALEGSLELHLGDRIALARRGLRIHKKLLKSSHGKTKGARNRNAKRARGHGPDVEQKCPPAIADTLRRVAVKITVRHILGKSLNVKMREMKENSSNKEADLGMVVEEKFDDMEDSGLSIMGKSVFESLKSSGGQVNVEDYVREWYYAKERWSGVHDEGSSIRFLFSLFMWECGLFAPVTDVFQTPYQDKPLDLFTEAFYKSRRSAIETRLEEISAFGAAELYDETRKLYERFDGTRAIGCAWSNYTVTDLAAISAGIGTRGLCHCFRLLCMDFSYWGAGLPDLTLWRTEEGKDGEKDGSQYSTKLVEVKSARDILSERQRAWLLEFHSAGVDCEVCKVVERATAQNAAELEAAQLDSVAISALDACPDEE